MTASSLKLNRFCKRIIAAMALPALVAILGTTSASAGALFTTDADCLKINGNIYAAKGDVRLNGGPDHGDNLAPNATYCVYVFGVTHAQDQGLLLNQTFGTVSTGDDGSFLECYNLYDLTHFDNTPNPGGEYRVVVCPMITECGPLTFPSTLAGCKSDNFKVRQGATCDGDGTFCIFCPDDFTECVTDFQNSCLGTIVIYSDPIVIGGTLDSCSPPSGSFFCLGPTTVTCTATSATSDTTQCTFVVTVSNTGDCGGGEQGCIIGGPTGGDLGCNPPLSDIPTCSSVALTTSDTCSVHSYNCVQHADSVLGCVHSRRITASATACDGTVCNYDQTFTWTVATAPVFAAGQGCGSTADLLCNPTSIPTCATASLPTASNECGPATVTCSQGSDSHIGCTYSRTLTFTATAACGGTSTCTRTYTWKVDTTGPVFSGCNNIIAKAPDVGSCCKNVTFSKPTAKDPCSGATLAVTCNKTSPLNVCVGTPVTVTCTATDACGVGGQCSFTVTLERCPLTQGYWKTHALSTWPCTPTLGGNTTCTPAGSCAPKVYTKEQLLAMFNQSPGSGSSANAVLILVDQLITAKLNKCNIAACGADVAGFGACADAAIAQADCLIGCLTITPCASGPNCSNGFAYVKVSSTLGQQMVAVASVLDKCNNSCTATQ